MVWRVMVIDDRGAPVPLVGLPSPFDSKRRHRFAVAGEGTNTPLTGRQRRKIVLWALMGLGLVVILGLIPASLSFGLRLPWWAVMALMIPTGAVPAVFSMLAVRKIVPERIMKPYVRAGYCASCGYDIAKQGVEADGCQVCPECGAAWREGAGPAHIS